MSDLRQAALDAASKARGGCDVVPALLSERQIADYAAACGEEKALSYVSSELGVPASTLLDVASGKLDPKRAALSAVKIDGVYGVDTSRWLTPDGDLDWNGVASSGVSAVAGAGAVAGCAATGVLAPVAPLCGSLGAAVGSVLYDAVRGWFAPDEPPVQGVYLTWHVSSLTMLSFAAELMTYDGKGPIEQSAAVTSVSDDVAATFLQHGLAPEAMRAYLAVRDVVLACFRGAEIAQKMYETATGQSIRWIEVFRAFQESGLALPDSLYSMCRHASPSALLVSTKDGYTQAYVHMHDLASFAVAQSNGSLGSDPAGADIDVAKVFGLTTFDDLAWQQSQEGGAGLSFDYRTDAPYRIGSFVFEFSAGIASYSDQKGLAHLQSVDKASYLAPTPGWRFSIGPWLSYGSGQGSDAAIARPARLFWVRQDVFSAEETQALAQPIASGNDRMLVTDATTVAGYYTFLPGTWWSRHAVFQLQGFSPWFKLSMLPGSTVRADAFGGHAGYDFAGEVFSLGTMQSYKAFDRLVVFCHAGLWRKCLTDPASVAAWCGEQMMRLERVLGIFRQSIRRWRRKNTAPDGSLKPEISTLDLSDAMAAETPWFDTGLGLLDDGDGEGAGAGEGAGGMLSGLSKPARYALGAAAVTAAGFLLAKLWKGIRR